MTRSQGVAGGLQRLITLAPSRVFSGSLKEGYRPVQVDHRLSGDLARVAVVAGEPADYRTVFLLDPGLAVLAVGPGAGEPDSPVGQYGPIAKP